MSDLQDAVNDANTTLTRRYEDLTKAADEAVNSNEISSAIADVAAKVSAANETISGLGATMFEQIEEMETVGGFAHCLVGMREKAQKMLDDAGRNLGGCDYPIRRVEMEFDESMGSWTSRVAAVSQEAQRDVLACLPAASAPAEEDIVKAVQCVHNEEAEAGHLFDESQDELAAILEDTRRQLEDGKYEAEKCVEVAKHVAFDQTGYLLSTLSQCIASGGTSSSSTTVTPIVV